MIRSDWCDSSILIIKDSLEHALVSEERHIIIRKRIPTFPSSICSKHNSCVREVISVPFFEHSLAPMSHSRQLPTLPVNIGSGSNDVGAAPCHNMRRNLSMVTQFKNNGQQHSDFTKLTSDKG